LPFISDSDLHIIWSVWIDTQKEGRTDDGLCNKLTPVSRILLETLVVTKLVNKFSAFYGTPAVSSLFHKS